MADLEFTLEDIQRLETRICELEEELDSVTKRKDEREHAVRQYETWLREARRERDEARAAVKRLATTLRLIARGDPWNPRETAKFELDRLGLRDTEPQETGE